MRDYIYDVCFCLFSFENLVKVYYGVFVEEDFLVGVDLFIWIYECGLG